MLSYSGNDKYKKKKKKITVKDLILDVKLTTIDSIKTINIIATQSFADSVTDINKIKIGVFVQRMFSQLKIASGIIKNGKCELEFPNDIPGDSIGNIDVFVKIEDDNDFGNIEKTQTIKWGIPVTEKESFKSSFSGGSYLLFWLFSLLLVLAIYLISKKIRIQNN